MGHEWMKARPGPVWQAFRRLVFICALSLACLAYSPTKPLYAQLPEDTYTVQPGDTLGSIAAQFDVTVGELAAANDLADVDVLNVGQVLNLPRENGSRGALFARPGDTVQSIAAREGLSADRLSILNRIAPEARLFPGQPVLLARDSPRPPMGLRFGAVRIVSVPSAVGQGEAGWLQVEASRPLALKAEWNGVPLGIWPLALRVDGGAGAAAGGEITIWGAYLPVPATMEPRDHQLRLSYEARSGVTVTRSFAVEVRERHFPSQQITLPAEQSDLLEQAILQAELDYLAPIWSQTATPVQWKQTFRLPLSSPFPTTSPYGIERSYNGGALQSFHTGHDFVAPGGSPVVAAGDGIVVVAEQLRVRGVSVVLDHGAGLFTGYWHLREAVVEPGAKVQAGEAIGFVGTTGRSTGEHLHWELRIYGAAVDPMPFLDSPLLSLLSEVGAEQGNEQGEVDRDEGN